MELPSAAAEPDTNLKTWRCGRVTSTAQRCDSIGVGYGAARRPDLRIVAILRRAIGTKARSLVNVGAGTGTTSRRTYASQRSNPSSVMITHP